MSSTEFVLRPINDGVFESIEVEDSNEKGGPVIVDDTNESVYHLNHHQCYQPGPPYEHFEHPKNCRVQVLPAADSGREYCCPLDEKIKALPKTQPILGFLSIDQNKEWKTIVRGLINLKSTVEKLRDFLQLHPGTEIPLMKLRKADRGSFAVSQVGKPNRIVQSLIVGNKLMYMAHDTENCICFHRYAILQAWNETAGYYSFPCRHELFLNLTYIYRDVWKILLNRTVQNVTKASNELLKKLPDTFQPFTDAGVVPGMGTQEILTPLDLSMFHCNGCAKGYVNRNEDEMEM